MDSNKVFLELDWRLSVLLKEIEGKKEELMGMDRVQTVKLLMKAHTINSMIKRAMVDGQAR